MPMKMKWFDEVNPDYDVAVTSRVRLARNIDKTPFPALLDSSGRMNVIRQIESSFKTNLPNGYTSIEFDKLDKREAASYVEYHAASPDFLNCQGERRLIVLPNESVSIMVNEEDHLRIQGISAGFSVENAYNYANSIDEILSDSLNYAFDEDFGYLTRCPTNLGTGMRASVMLHLPALTATGDIEKINYQISKLGLIIRGFYGEGTKADGNLYQVSNQITLGITEEGALEKLHAICSQIIGFERNARKLLTDNSPDELRDRVMRSYGTALYAHQITSAEFYKLYSDIRLGITCGIIKDVKPSALDRLLLECQASNMSLRAGNLNRDIVRAEYIRKTLGGIPYEK